MTSDHYLEDFDSGKPPLDRWLRESALSQMGRHISNTFVWTEGGSTAVIAYTTLMAHTVLRDDAPSRIGRGGPAMIPAMLIAKLALHRDLHNRKLGADLLIDALTRCLGAATLGPGARIVVVDALDGEARAFYEHMGFLPLAKDSVSLYRTMASIEDSLAT